MLGTTIIGLFSIVMIGIDTNIAITAKCIAISFDNLVDDKSGSSLSSYSKFSLIVKLYPRPSSVESDSSYLILIKYEIEGFIAEDFFLPI